MTSVTTHAPEPAQTDDERIGAAIRERREALKLSQGQLSEAAGLPAGQSVSVIEKGERTVKASELVRIARALHIEPSALLGTPAMDTPRVLWRRGSMDKNRVREAQILERARRYAQLERWCNDRAEAELPDQDFDPVTAGPKDAEHLAERIRRELDLGPIPARTLRQRLEDDYGVKIFFEALSNAGKDDGSAACVRHPEFGAAILMGTGEVTWRQAFSFAHELFHLVTWTAVKRAWDASSANPDEEPEWYEHLEAMANSFAAALLMPMETLSARFDARVRAGKIARADLAQLAVEFGVSTQALVIRLVGLNRLKKALKQDLVNDPHLRDLSRALRPESEPDPVGPFPPRFVALARTAYLRREVGKSLLAKYLERNVADLGDFQLTMPDDREAALTVT